MGTAVGAACGVLSHTLRIWVSPTTCPALPRHGCMQQDWTWRRKDRFQNKQEFQDLFQWLLFLFCVFHQPMALRDLKSSQFQTLKPPHYTSGPYPNQLLQLRKICCKGGRNSAWTKLFPIQMKAP